LDDIISAQRHTRSSQRAITIKTTRTSHRLSGEQLDSLRVAASAAADQAIRKAAAQPQHRARFQRDAAAYRRLAGLLRDAVAAELTLWTPDRD
jgi:hypothetical protein